MADSYFDSVAKRRRRAQEKLDKASPRPFQGPQRAIQGPVEAPRGSAGVRSEKLGPERPPRKKPEVVTPTQGPLQGTKPSWMPSAADPAQEESPKDLKQIIADIFAPVEDTHPLQKAQDATGPSSFRKTFTGDTRTASRFRKEQVPDSVEASYVSARREMPKKMSPQDEETLRSAVFMLGVDPETYAGGGKVDQKELRQLITRFRKDKAGVQREVEEFRANRDSRSKDRMGVTGKVSATASPEPTEWTWLFEQIGDKAPASVLARAAGVNDDIGRIATDATNSIEGFFNSDTGQSLGAGAVFAPLSYLPKDNPVKSVAAGLTSGIAQTAPSLFADYYGKVTSTDPFVTDEERLRASTAIGVNLAGAEWGFWLGSLKRGASIVPDIFKALKGQGFADDIAQSAAQNIDNTLRSVPPEKLDEFVPQEAAGYDPGVVPDLKAGLDEVPPGPPPANQLNPTQKPSPSAGADGFSGGKADVKAIDDELGDVYHGTDSGGANGDLPRNGQGSAIPGERPAGQGQGDVVTSRTAEVAPKSPRVADIERDLADVLPKNHAVKDVFETDGGTVLADVRRTLDSGGYIDTRISIAPDGTVKHVSSHHWYKTAGMRAWEQVPYKKPNWVVGAESQKYTPTAPTSPALAPDVPKASADAVPKAGADGVSGGGWSPLREYKGDGGKKFKEYALRGDRTLGMLTVELDAKNGWRVRNVFVDPSVGRSGMASEGYRALNAESLAATGKPLRSSNIGYGKKVGDPTTMSDDGVALWESFVNSGDAVKVGNHYEMVAKPATPPVKQAGPNAPKTPKVEDVPPAKPPKSVAESAVPDEPVKPQGVSHAEVDDLRKEMGWTPRDPAKAKPDADLAADAKKLEGDESAIADKVLGDADNKVTLGDEEAVALGKKLTSLKQRMLAAKAANDVDAFDLADAQAQKIADALDLSGTRQGRAFRARRFLFKDQEDAWTLNRRARKANQDQPLDTKQQANLDKRIEDLEKANAALAKERDDAIKSLSDSRNNPRPSRNGPLTSQKRRSAALNSLRKLGITVADDTVGAASGGMKSKRSGAINIPQGSTEQVARAIRGLVRSYADTGISKWDDVLAKLKADLPGIDEEQALFILSGKYKVAKVEADLAKKAVNKFMSNVQADAVYRTKPLVKKIGQAAFELFNTAQRSFQTTLDNSLALIQGRSVLMSRPGTWLKGVGKSFQALAKKDPIAFANKVMAEMENDVNYAKAVQAKLGLSDIDGSFSRQEEAFAGKLQDVVPGLSHSKAMATVLMNMMRFDLFRKMIANLAADAPAEAYEDIARYINVITGKGDGQVAQWLGGKPASIVSYAPRLYWSRFQHSIGQPIWAAKTAAGRKEALKGYGMQIAGYSAALATAEAFGWDVELDPRSTNFGRASKDGINFDLFHSSSEGVRVATQLSLGRISQKGNYKAPGDYGSFTFGGYVDSKASPVARTALRAATGKTYDYDEGKTRDAVASDYWGNFIPLSIQEMYKNKEVPLSFPASFMGAGVGKVKPKEKSQKTIPPLPTDPIVKPVEDIIKGLINKK